MADDIDDLAAYILESSIQHAKDPILAYTADGSVQREGLEARLRALKLLNAFKASSAAGAEGTCNVAEVLP